MHQQLPTNGAMLTLTETLISLTVPEVVPHVYLSLYMIAKLALNLR